MNDKNTTPVRPLSRRKLLLAAGATGTMALAGCAGRTDDQTGSPDEDDSNPGDEQPRGHRSPALERWVDEVPRPATQEPTGTKDGQPYYEIEMRESQQKLHRDLPETTVWGYEGSFPGPTIEAEQGEPIYVRWTNNLPDEHLFPVDTTVHGDIIPYDIEGVRTVTHLHGGNVEAASDGKARGWFTRDFAETGPDFEKKDYYYANDQPPATLWYHDHALGITRLNVYAGLSGFYLLRNDHERSLGLPDGEYEIPLVLQDRKFTDDGAMYYPDGPVESESPDPSIVPQFYGDVSTVNGKAWPRLSVEPRLYRFRLLNGANSRYYRLALLEYDEQSGETGAAGPEFVQIGTDGGLLPSPVELDGRLELGSAQRADVLVDFSEYAGETLLVHNDAPAMYRGQSRAEADDVEPLPEIMLIDVEEGEQTETNVPETLTRVPELSLEAVDTERYLPLLRSSDEYGRPLFLLGSEGNQSGHRLTDPATETPTVGDTELWSIPNLTGMSHPIHLHLVHFQVLGRQSVGYDPGDEIDPDSLRPPKQFERGWSDVVSVDPGEVVHILVHFGEYEGLFTDQTGEYMWHCHMIEHEDHDMMRPLDVRSTSEEGSDD
ncbi:multicopper oxidase domain-containing protein [Halovenus sp. WSH3]|uniref:Multicopper oxidase domain-containing protein n=1 Tax=Halovenus carboxidivorans TaxID=2692199 RepID=A0A6B0T5Y9_9EURY|nr:multicopper oxidase [Halovenus carboxidivorans]MXR52337.1 multicopper oxidase domain-containing protein [Halovenus carboxidivorans]